MSTSHSSTRERLLRDLRNEEFRHDYDDEFLDMHISAQIRALREDRKMTQKELADAAGTGQSKISEMESDYHSWSLRTLRKLARAFGVRLFVSFESWGELIPHAEGFRRENLVRPKFEDDDVFHPKAALPPAATVGVVKEIQAVIREPRKQTPLVRTVKDWRRQDVWIERTSGRSTPRLLDGGKVSNA
jgi:transcriptional regulator with XRE-family HTH domain